MTENVHTVERILRVLIGITILVVGLSYFEMAWWGWLGLIPLITGLVGFCPFYRLFGLSTK